MSSNRIDILENVVGSVVVAGGHGNSINVTYLINVILGDEILRRKNAKQADREPSASAGEIGPNPYQSLDAFDETTSHLFFGREAIADKIVQKLAALWHNPGSAPRMLTIMGPSGCGKSSIARAGIVPRLAKNAVAGFENATVVIFQPGPRPIEALSVALARLATGDPTPAAKAREFHDVLTPADPNGPFDGLARLARMLVSAKSPLIILADQFEETWTHCRPGDPNNEVEKERARAERAAFVNALLYAASELNGRVMVVLTLRSDFLGETREVSSVNQAIAQSHEIVPVLSSDELAAAIAEPAKVAGRPLDKEIIRRLLFEVEGQGSSLPLLQFALYRIWEGFRKGLSEGKTLDALQGVGGALAFRAEELFQAITDGSRQTLVRRAFEEMVQLGEGTRDTRRRVLLAYTIPPGVTKDEATAVLEPFVEERLVSKGLDENGHVMLELTHEALIQHWHRLRQWIDERREDLHFVRRVQQAVTGWRDGHPSGRLWRAPDLDLLIEHARRCPQDMTEEANEFLRRSQHRAAREWWMVRSFVGAISVLLVVVTILAIDTARAARIAEEQRAAAQREAALSAAINRFLNDDLLRAGDPTAPHSIADPSLRTILARAAQRLQSDLTQPPLIRGSIELTLGETYTGLGDYPNAKLQLHQAIEAAPDNEQGKHLRARAEYALARVMLLDSDSKFRDAKPLLDQADRDAGAELSKPTLLAVIAHLVRGAYLDDLDENPKEALAEFEIADRIRQLSAPDDVVLLFDTRRELIDAYIAARRFREAKAAATPLLAQTFSIDRVGIENWARIRESFAEILSRDKSFSSAIAMDQTALAALHAQLGERHYYVGVGLSELANVYLDAGQMDDALTNMQRAYDILKTVLGEGSQNALGARGDVDVIELALGGGTAALVDLTECRDRLAKLFDSDNPQVEFFNYFLALNLGNRGREAEAWAIASTLSAASLISVGEGGEDWPERLQALKGLILLREGQKSEAADLLAPAVAKMEEDRLALWIVAPFRKALAEVGR